MLLENGVLVKYAVRMSETPGTPEPPWRTPPRRGRSAPRPQLSRELVVSAALKVIEVDGGDALTMRRVADEIGVSASALYGYVANKEELVQLVLEQIIGEIPQPGDMNDGACQTATGKTWCGSSLARCSASSSAIRAWPA